MLQQRRLGAENEVTTEGRTGAPEVDPENDRGVMETPRLPTGTPSLRGWQDLVVKATTDTSCPDELTRVILGLREWHDRNPISIVNSPMGFFESHKKRSLYFHPY